MIALIDADIVVYQAAARAEGVMDWEDDTVSITGSKSETEEGIDSMVADLKKIVGANRVLMVFSDTENYRKKVYTQYKANRAGKRKPVTYAYGKAYAKKRYDSMTREGLEADDCLGILATGEVAGFLADKVVCSIDKDMRSFPCSLYNWKKPDDGVVVIDPLEADANFYLQVLTGDSVDGYPGCPGIGPKRAVRLLEEGPVDWADPRTVWAVVVAAYKKAGLTEDDAVTQARCARILRATDYEFKTKSPILWTPPKGESNVRNAD